MSEQVIEIQGEEIQETALALTPIQGLIKPQDQALLAVIEQMDSLDWAKLKPHQVAVLLMQKPFNAPGGGTMTLTFKQALIMAYRCAELQCSPFSGEVWFNTQNSSVNLSYEGKKRVARNMGLDIGPAQFEWMERPWEKVPRISDNGKAAQQAGFKHDVGVRCKMRVGPVANAEYAIYDCWLSDWYQPRSPIWKDRATHMIMTRAAEKALSMAMGTGASEPIDD